MNIRAYLKPHGVWSRGVRAIMRKYDLPFALAALPEIQAQKYEEMVRRSGQPLSPCVEIDGVMLVDVSGEDVENYLLANDLVKSNDARTGEPAQVGCADGEKAKMATKTIRFF